MVGDVDDTCDLGNHLQQRRLNALAEGHRSQPAALTATAETQKGCRVLNCHQLGDAAVSGDGGVDLLIEDLLHALGGRGHSGLGAAHPD